MHRYKGKDSGFTIIEILVVVGIIAIILALSGLFRLKPLTGGMSTWLQRE